MHKYIKRIICLTLVCLAMIFLPVSIQAQSSEISYDITNAHIKADISAEGMITFTDTYTYKVDKINGIIFNVDFKGAYLNEYRMGIRNPETGKITYFTESSSRMPNTYQTTINDDLLTYKVFYPAEDESVEFVFEYSMDGLVTNYIDTAEINRKLVGTEINEPLDISADIILPGKVEKKEDLRAWLYGDPQGNISLKNEGNLSEIHVEVPNNSANQFVEVNAIFPTSLMPNNSKVIEEKQKDQIIERNNNRVKEDRNQYRLNQGLEWLKVLLAILVGPLVTLRSIIYYFREKKRLNPNPMHVPEHVYELPEEITPAIMAAAYMNRKISPDDFSATILDLARRKYIELIEVDLHQRSGIFNRGQAKTIQVRKLKELNGSDLQKHEIYVMQYLFADDNDEVYLNELEAKIKEQTSYSNTQNRLWTKFSNYAQVMGEQHMRESYPARIKSRKLVVFSTLTAILLVPILMMYFLPADKFNQFSTYIITIIIINILLNIMMLLLIKFKPLYSKQEDYLQKSWDSFARMLEDIGQIDMREVASLPLWDEYLVYAVSLGVADKVIEAMNKTYSSSELEQGLTLSGGFYQNTYMINNALRGSLRSSIASSQPKVSKTVGQYRGNNTGGFGGGASGGSSGGSGGRGGTGGF